VADTLVDQSGCVVGTHGFYVDITPMRNTQEPRITAVVYAVDADVAFQLLRWQSQHYNVKLRLVAEQIAEDFTKASQQKPVARGCYDNLLLTAHSRAAVRI
jgi:hypothetical protein